MTTQSDNTLDELILTALQDNYGMVQYCDGSGMCDKGDIFDPGRGESGSHVLYAEQVDTLKTALTQWRDDAVQTAQLDLLTRLEAEYDVSEKRSGTGSRCQFSKDTETRGEAYSRSQGFKSGMIIAKQKLQSERALIEKRMM